MRLPPSLKWAAATLLAIGAAVSAIADGERQRRALLEPAVPAAVEAQPPDDGRSDRLAELLAASRATALPEQALGDPFARRHWAPAPKTASAGSAGKRAAPPFPFRHAGWVQHGSAVTVYLARSNELFPVKVGAVLEGFRIDAIRDGRIEVTWVAQGEKVIVQPSSQAGTGDGNGTPAAPAAITAGERP